MTGLKLNVFRRYKKSLAKGSPMTWFATLLGALTLYVIIFRPTKLTQKLFEMGLPLKPVWINPLVGRISSPFGDRKNPNDDYQTTEFHNGVDIAVPAGTKIVSPRDGVVFKQWSSELGGTQLLIKHDNGYVTGYAHLSSYDVFLDQPVKQGDFLGSTGIGGTGAHLHFTVTDSGGIKINPEEIFSFS